MLPVPNAIHKVKKIKKNKKKKPHLSGEISSNNDSPNIKPEIKFEELHNQKQRKAVMTKIQT